LDIWKYFAIGHADHVFCNPMSEAKFDEMIGLITLAPGDRVVDIACGKAEFLVRVVEKWGCSGVGVDLSPPCVADARAKAESRGVARSLEVLECEGSKYEAAPESFQAAVCLGASWIWGGYAGMLDAMSNFASPGGFVLLGEPFWRRVPSEAHREATGLQPDSFDTHAGNLRAGEERGLTPLHSIVSSEDDWDHYEGRQWYATERYAAENPDDPDVPELLAAMRKNREQYLSWGRDELGWAIYLFRKTDSAP
jgi:hypothetical protein